MNDKTANWESFRIPAMDCAEEFRMISEVLADLAGVDELRADYLNRELKVKLDSATVSRADVSQHLKQIGFPEDISAASTVDSDSRTAGSVGNRWTLRHICVVVGIAALVVAAVLYFLPEQRNVSRWVAAMAAVLAGVPVAQAAWRAVRLRRIEMNGLMVIAATGAIALGETFEAGVAMVLFGVSNWLEELSLARARRAVTSLANLMPKLAHKVHDSKCGGHDHEDHGHDHDHSHDHATAENNSFHVHDIAVNLLKVGDRVLVRTGERIPVDGQVIEGNSAVDQSPITGESLPVDRGQGDKVYAGSLNGNGSLVVEVTGEASESTLAHVARLVEQARSNPSPTERFVDRFARWYTPTMIGIACLMVLLGPLIVGSASYLTGLGEWLHRGLVLLVIACPCALVISTPITIICGLHRATTLGLLIKGGEFIENAGKVDSIVFDKTVTLTTGELAVTNVPTFADTIPSEILALAAGLEQHSEHPVAVAIRQKAVSELVAPLPLQGVQSMQGRGVHGRDGSVQVAAGRVELFDALGIQLPGEVKQRIDSINNGIVVVVGSSDGKYGLIHLQDSVRGEASSSLQRLRDIGIRDLRILSGDR
ncbi:MAG: cation-translocating P-type ATPase, partial [Planctomycetota bacterium]